MRKCIIIFGIAMLLAGCTEDIVTPGKPEGGRMAMSFAAGATTRAMIPLQDKYLNFGVWANKAMPGGTTQNVMEGYDVHYAASGWYYAGIGTQTLKYWDTSADSYHFHGVAPFPSKMPAPTRSGDLPQVAVEGDYVMNLAADDTFGDGSITTTLGSTAVTEAPATKMVAHTRRTMTGYVHDDDMIPTPNGVLIQPVDTTITGPLQPTAEVPLRFHPLLTQVEFYIYCDPEATTPATYTSVTIASKQPIVTAGDYTPGPTYENETTKTFGFNITDLSLLPANPTTPHDDAEHVGLFYELPQPGMELEAVLTQTGGLRYTTVITIPEGWREGTHYVYYLKINPINNDIILADFVIAPWQYSGDITFGDDEPLINW